MKELKIIGKNIVKLRKKQNLTQEDLCGLAQIDRSYLSEIENGKMNVTIKSLVSIADALDCELKDLII
ncbi:MAG: helix-turn-helix transcriptional regulator [Alphaproteobacteria bacterium]